MDTDLTMATEIERESYTNNLVMGRKRFWHGHLTMATGTGRIIASASQDPGRRRGNIYVRDAFGLKPKVVFVHSCTACAEQS